MITMPQKLMASDPPGTLPSGYYLRFESLDDPTECLLFSKGGHTYKVKKKDLKDAIEQGYVRA